MSQFLLDTNVCIRLLNGTSANVAAELAARDVADVLMSAIVKTELFYGARRSSRPEDNLRTLHRFFDPFVSVDFRDRAAQHAGWIRAELADRGTPIGPLDVMIAASARAHDLTLVTNNTREFGRVLGLRLVDWQ
jgi:tRNA(fMet)-specific endonuclease VapC